MWSLDLLIDVDVVVIVYERGHVAVVAVVTEAAGSSSEEKRVREKLLLSCRARSAPYLAQKSWLSRSETRLDKLVISSACEIISSILFF